MLKRAGLAAVFVLLGLAFAAPPLQAEILSSSAERLDLKTQGSVKASPQKAYQDFLAIQNWWDGAHTFSGNARNLRLKAKPGGGWIETLPEGGFVRHMEVIYAEPAQRLKLQGGLGPMQDMPVAAVMTVSFEADGAGAKVTLTYSIAAPSKDAAGLTPLAKPVDGVLTAQFERYLAYANRAAR